ncbi:hypothetical protein HDU67_004231 [Dinochytrium kinnereticum]|nr:hypothetical protein HDU67_004231 [Dinochytrium kinnereticum]
MDTPPAEMGCMVFWDIENVPVPSGMRGEDCIRRLKTLVLNANHGISQSHSKQELHARARHQSNGIIQTRFIKDIVAVSAVDRMAPTIRNQLQESGVVMLDCASGKASAADMAIMVEILKDFAKVLNQLDAFGYEVILIHQPNVPDALLAAAKEAYNWNDEIHTGINGFDKDRDMYRNSYGSPNSQQLKLPGPRESLKKTSSPGFDKRMVETHSPKGNHNKISHTTAGYMTTSSRAISVLLDAIDALKSNYNGQEVRMSALKQLLPDDMCEDLGHLNVVSLLYSASESGVVGLLPCPDGDIIVRTFT